MNTVQQEQIFVFVFFLQVSQAQFSRSPTVTYTSAWWRLFLLFPSASQAPQSRLSLLALDTDPDTVSALQAGRAGAGAGPGSVPQGRGAAGPTGSQRRMPSARWARRAPARSAMSHFPLMTSIRQTRYGKWWWRSFLRAVPPDSAPSPSSDAWEQGGSPRAPARTGFCLLQSTGSPSPLPDQWFPPLPAGQSSGSGSELLITVSTAPVEKLLSLQQPGLAEALLELTPVCCCQMVLCVPGENHPHQQLADGENRSSHSGLLPCGSVFSLLDVTIGPVCWLWLG